MTGSGSFLASAREEVRGPPAWPFLHPPCLTPMCCDARQIDCPSHLVGRVIGRGGETIMNLQIRRGSMHGFHFLFFFLNVPSYFCTKCCRSGCRIYIHQDVPEDQPRRIVVMGTPQSVHVGASMVREVMEFGPPEHNRHNPYLYNKPYAAGERPFWEELLLRMIRCQEESQAPLPVLGRLPQVGRGDVEAEGAAEAVEAPGGWIAPLASAPQWQRRRRRMAGRAATSLLL